MTTLRPTMESLRAAINADRRRLCNSLGLRADNGRFFCPQCQNDGESHTDGDFSIEVGFKCHKCKWKGDGLDLVCLVKSCDFHAAVDFARDVYGIHDGAPPSTTKPPVPQRKAKKTHLTIDDAVKAVAWGLKQTTKHEWTETRRDLYRNAEGRDVAAVIRFDRADGTTDAQGKPVKTFRPVHGVPDGWRTGDPPGLWPLFNLPEILASAGPVYFCEGEKAACAGTQIGLTCTTWPHGADGIGKADFSPLVGRDVILLPDNDAPGRKAMQNAAAILAALDKPARVRIVVLPGLPSKGDLDDFVALRSGQSPDGIRNEIMRLVESAPLLTAPAPAAATTTDGALDGAAESIRARLWEISQEKISATEAHRKKAAAVLEWLHGRGRFYYHADRRDFPSVMYFDTARKLLLPVQSDAFLAWLADRLAMNRAERSFAFVQSACETEGLSARSTGIQPATFWAATPSAYYLSNGPGQMVRISAVGVEIVDNGTDNVLFPYGATIEPWALVEPADPFETCSVFRDMSIATPYARELLRLWLLAILADLPCKPPACVSSVIGGGKTALVRCIFKLLGIPEQINAVTKNGEGDFWATLDGGGLACFDNVDTRIDWLPDALAAAATAGSHQKRKLYTDAERITLRARAAVAVTSASPSFAADAGLADRLIVIRLQRRTGETAESALFDEVARNRDAALSWISQTLAATMGDTAPVPGGMNARHPDFARLAVRIGRAIGRETEAVAALQAAEADKGLFNLENDNIGAALLELLQAGPFNGTAAELLAALIDVDHSFEGKLSVKRLGKRLSKLWPHLANVFHAEQERDGHTRTWRYAFHPPSVAGFAGYETAFSEKSYTRENIESFTKTPIETPHTPQPTFAWTEDMEPESNFEEGEI